jgi:hypothetical protein
MFTQILVAYDRSPYARAAVGHAVDIGPHPTWRGCCSSDEPKALDGRRGGGGAGRRLGLEHSAKSLATSAGSTTMPGRRRWWRETGLPACRHLRVGGWQRRGPVRHQ